MALRALLAPSALGLLLTGRVQGTRVSDSIQEDLSRFRHVLAEALADAQAKAQSWPNREAASPGPPAPPGQSPGDGDKKPLSDKVSDWFQTGGDGFSDMSELLRAVTGLVRAKKDHRADAEKKVKPPPDGVDWGFELSLTDTNILRDWIDWDRSKGWSSPRPEIDLHNQTLWPPVEPKKKGIGSEFGLDRPIIWVLSMADRVDRRHRFSAIFKELCLTTGFSWAPAIDGRTIPENLRWLLGRPAMQGEGDFGKPGRWACYVSHLAMARQTQKRCGDCDLVVFEDDVVFHPQFVNHWRRFLEAVPDDWDMLRIGSTVMWEPLEAVVNEHVLKASHIGNTWGYVVRARSIDKFAGLLAALPVRGTYGVDGVLTTFAEKLVTYAPTIPLVLTASACSDTEDNRLSYNCAETEQTLSRAAVDKLKKWSQGYTRTYCSGPGALITEGLSYRRADFPGCKGDPFAPTCCPYKMAEEKPVIPVESETFLGYNDCPSAAGGPGGFRYPL